jgi:hypothetical protein
MGRSKTWRSLAKLVAVSMNHCASLQVVFIHHRQQTPRGGDKDLHSIL